MCFCFTPDILGLDTDGEFRHIFTLSRSILKCVSSLFIVPSPFSGSCFCFLKVNAETGFIAAQADLELLTLSFSTHFT